MSLPEITGQPIIIVDATPDEEYPLRILKAYRQNCNVQWSDTTNPGRSVTNPLFKMMNEQNDKRADVLDRAIAKLENSPSMNIFAPIDPGFVANTLTDTIQLVFRRA